MKELRKVVRKYEAATNGETDRLRAIEAMNSIITATEERLVAVNDAGHAVNTVATLLHDANDILEDEVRLLSGRCNLYKNEMEKHGRLVEQSRSLISLASPAICLMMLSPDRAG